MIFIVYVMLLAMTLFVTKIKYNTILKSNIIFTSMWSIFAGISSLGLLDIYKPSMLIHLYSFTTIIVFNVSFFIFNKATRSKIYTNEPIIGATRLKLIYIVNLISWIYILKFIPMVISIISMYGLRGIRDYAFNSSMGLASTVELLIIQWIIQSIFIATILIAMINLVLQKNNHLLTFIAFLDVGIYTIMFGGRYLIVRMIFYYVVAVLITKTIDSKTFKSRKVNKLFIAIVLFLLIVITNLRTWSDISFIDSVIIYYTGSFPFLDIIVNEFDWKTAPLFGAGMFGFIFNLVIAPFTLIFDIPYIGSNQTISELTSFPRYISPNIKYNSMTTMLYPFIRDFGYTGIIIGSIFLAWLISIAETIYVKSKKLLYLSLYVYLTFVLFDSVMSYQLIYPSASITVGFVILFVSNKRKSTT